MILQQPFAIPGNKIWTTPLTIDHTKAPSDQTNFPVLLNYTDNRFKTTTNGGHIHNSSAFDLGFFSDSAGATPLKWEIERYNGTSGEVVAWIKIPTVSSSVDTTFYARYGSKNISTDQSDPTNVWTNSFLGVYHLKDGTTLSVADSLNSNNGTNHSATAVAGQIDGGAGLVSASSQYIDCGTGMNDTSMTYSAWAKATSFPNAYNTVVGRSVGGCYFELYVKSTGKLACYAFAVSDRSYDGTGTNTLSTGTWYHLAITYLNDSTANGGGLKGYVNGSQDGSLSVNSVGLCTTAARSDIGQDANTAGRFWNGSIDEVHVANVARSANWLLTEYNNQNAPTTFITLGTET